MMHSTWKELFLNIPPLCITAQISKLLIVDFLQQKKKYSGSKILSRYKKIYNALKSKLI